MAAVLLESIPAGAELRKVEDTDLLSCPAALFYRLRHYQQTEPNKVRHRCLLGLALGKWEAVKNEELPVSCLG